MSFILALILFFMILLICLSIGKAVETATYNLVNPDEKNTNIYVFIEEDNSGYPVRRKPNPRSVYSKK